jgi:hypothetical protein
LQGGNRLLAAGGRRAKGLEPSGVLLVAAVREVQARDVHPRLDELLEGFSRIAGRAYGANYLGFSIEHVARGLWQQPSRQEVTLGSTPTLGWPC